jgi:outer membrane murein-binding lipoprotein Lpp
MHASCLKTILINFPTYGDMPRTRKTAPKSTRPIGVPHHQLASRHEGSSSGSNDPIGDLEAQVEQLRTELRHRNRVWAEDGQRINELAADVRCLQDELAELDLAVDWAVNSRSVAWDREAKAHARVTELSAALDNLQVYYNTLHEEVHVLYSRLHPDVPADPVPMGVGPSWTIGEGTDEELDLFRPPSMNLADDRTPTSRNKETKDDED